MRDKQFWAVLSLFSYTVLSRSARICSLILIMLLRLVDMIGHATEKHI
jgi:hypothetical protein